MIAFSWLLIAFYFCFQMAVVINSLFAYPQCEKKCEWKAELPRYKRVKHDEGKRIVALHLNHLRLYCFWKCEILPEKVYWVTNVKKDKKAIASLDQETIFIKKLLTSYTFRSTHHHKTLISLCQSWSEAQPWAVKNWCTTKFAFKSW